MKKGAKPKQKKAPKPLHVVSPPRPGRLTPFKKDALAERKSAGQLWTLHTRTFKSIQKSIHYISTHLEVAEYPWKCLKRSSLRL